MAEVVGKAPCPDCGDEAEIKEDKRKFLYLDCPCCGIFKYQRHTGQKRIRARLEKYSNDGRSSEPGTGNIPDPVPENKEVPAPAKKRLLENLFKRNRV